ncbi:Hypothetical protein DHA2_153000 [Giardia duodenalis]|uniref:Uncharacterized protein n=1 Tax=Giardia intestinalis TaxID=5741 RepID=V6TJW7_GIAIN|nr:Hypothetical protein DHA2_153000 [Giardia intestinalis]
MVSPCLTIEVQSGVLHRLAKEVIDIKQLEETVDDLVASPCRLYAYVVKTPIDWQRIAKEVGADRKRIYHWYRETHSRHILTIKMTDDDREEIRNMLINWIKHRRVLDEQLYKEIHKRFGTRYSRQELRMTYNNMLNSRCIRSVLTECNVQRPVRRRKMNESKHKEHTPDSPRATSPLAVSHVSNSTPDLQPTSLSKEDLYPLSSHKLPLEASILSSEPNTVPDDARTDTTSSHSDTPIHALVQNPIQYPPVFVLLSPQATTIPFNTNAQMAYISLILVEPPANICPPLPAEG